MSPGKRGLGLMSEPHLTLPGPRDSLETWLRPTHCLLALLGDAQDIFHLCWPKARQGHPGSPQPSVREESRLEEPVTPKMKTTCWAWLSLKPQAHSSLSASFAPQPLLSRVQGVGRLKLEDISQRAREMDVTSGWPPSPQPPSSLKLRA